MNLTRKQIDGDSDVEAVREACLEYASGNPKIETFAYRQNLGSIRLKVVDPRFASMDQAARYQELWPFLTTLPSKVQGQISVFLLLAPDEVATSYANLDFDNPSRSSL